MICERDETKTHSFTDSSGDTTNWVDGDFVFVQHTVGALLVRGNLIGKKQNNFGGGKLAVTPSAVGGDVITGWANWLGGGQTGYGQHDYFYIGSGNTVVNGDGLF